MKKHRKRPVRLLYKRKPAAPHFTTDPALLAWMEQISGRTGHAAKAIPKIVVAMRTLLMKLTEVMRAVSSAGLEQLQASLTEEELQQLAHLSWQRNELTDLLQGCQIDHELE